MNWEKIGTELPVEDEKGDRPKTGEDGQARDTEIVPWAGTDYLEFVVDDMAKASDRRLFEAMTDNLARHQPSSPAAAVDFDTTLATVCMRFIKAVRDTLDNNREYKGEAIAPFLLEELEYADSVHLIYWLRGKVYLARSKKKNSKPQSG